MMKTELNWITPDENLPPAEIHDYYGERYSGPCMIGNEFTGQVSGPWCYDHHGAGWVLESMEEGADPEDYECQHVTHWAAWPRLITDKTMPIYREDK